MWGPATAIAISDMYRLAGEAVLQVRAELFRLRCSGVIFVEQEETCLKLTYDEKSFITEPQCLLTVLKETHDVESADGLWQTIIQETAQHQERTKLRIFIVMFSLICVLTIIATIVFLAI